MTVLDHDGYPYREEPGRYRGEECHTCHGTIWRALVSEQTGTRKLRCLGCGHIRYFPWGGLTFEREVA